VLHSEWAPDHGRVTLPCCRRGRRWILDHQMDQLSYASASLHSVLQNRLAAPFRPARGRTSQWAHQAERAIARVRHPLVAPRR
jgi:hypothetical protein